MGVLKNIWRKITQTNALNQSSGDLETAFFESIYRVTYATGLSTTDKGVGYLLYSSVVKLLIVMAWVGEVWFVCSETLSLDDIAACINVTGIQVITICKVKNMMDYKNVYRRVAVSMESPYFDTNSEGRRRLVRHWADTHDRYLNLLLILGNCTLTAWHLYPFLDELEYNLMVGIRVPFQYNTPLRYPFTYILVGMAFIYSSYFVMVTDLIMQAHMVPLICQLSVLSDCFRNIIGDCKEEIEDCNDLPNNKEFARRYLRKLGNFVEQHNRILTHTMDLRAVLSGPLLCQLAASGSLICFVGFQAATTLADDITKGLMSIFYLGYNMFGLYIICRWCEEITVQSKNIGEAIYCSGWETGMTKLPGVRASLMMVVARANKPLFFTAGGMYNLSLSAYATLVKTSYSALTVLLRFRHD